MTARRYAVVGTGGRAGLYIRALAGPYADEGTIVAWCDPNPVRMSYYDEILSAAGRPAPARYAPGEFSKLLEAERPDAVIVTSPDRTHPEYAAAALLAGRDAISEKPLATSAPGARLLAETARTAPGTLTVTFNYRYMPRNATLRQVIASGVIGTVTSVHFEWVLDTMHGADYFRRWHREKANSGGLLVHKASHHFDLVNWWIADIPDTVYARGALRFYGSRAARARGMGPRPARSAGAPAAGRDPWALDLAADPVLRRLYLEAEEADGYVRDQDVFGEGITIEDSMAVLVTYKSGAFLTYSLTAHSPWEGYRVSVTGDAGRAELEVVERGQVRAAGDDGITSRPAVDPMTAGDRDSAMPDGPIMDGPVPDGPILGGPIPDGPIPDGSAPNGPVPDDPRPVAERLIVQRHWEPARVVPIPPAVGTHAGGDTPLLDSLFLGGAARDAFPPDPLGRRAGYADGLASAAVGIAANESIATGRPVSIASLGLSGP